MPAIEKEANGEVGVFYIDGAESKTILGRLGDKAKGLGVAGLRSGPQRTGTFSDEPISAGLAAKANLAVAEPREDAEIGRIKRRGPLPRTKPSPYTQAAWEWGILTEVHLLWRLKWQSRGRSVLGSDCVA